MEGLLKNETTSQVVSSAHLQKIQCPICLDPFKTPKIFTKCGHSICEYCETIMLGTQERRFTCPVCRTETQLKVGEVLPVNWTLKGLV
ncbi:hypothetical protein L596_028932 [Steinernema carpocapsae]|uniref:RING-type domain-containing protein n=1 Tax=Steinernema carpocapsae TaxID=34508 RepID=A0A4U5LZU5_STECR|nr:hypothetical protein L596_028932 [Steinernema carpocapsae]